MSDHAPHDDHDRYRLRLSEYIDGDLSPSDRENVAMHVRACARCAGEVDELRLVVAWIKQDREDDAPRHGWPRMRARIKGSWWVERWPLAAAAVAAVLIGAVWLTLNDGASSTLPIRQPAALPAPAASSSAASFDRSAAYQAAVTDLETVLREGRNRLKPETVRAIEQSLAAIDAAEHSARAALAADPANEFVQSYLETTRQRRMHVLRQVADAIGQRS